jgi:hypothetical protein
VDELNLTVATNGSGFYAIVLPVGSWTVRASAPGYVDSVADNVIVTAQAQVSRDFTLAPIPRILIVDDDDNGPDVSRTYTYALDQLGEDYLVWDTANSDNEPDADYLRPFSTVLWFTGDEVGGAAGPGAAGEAALADWLDHSGCLLLSSQDYHADRGMTPFMGAYLGLASVDGSVVSISANGAGIFSGFGPYFLNFPYTNAADRVYPDGSAAAAMTSGSAPLAISKDTGVYRTNFWGFGFEGIPGPANQRALLAHLLDWCDALALQDGDADGIDNAADCHAGDPNSWSIPTEARDLTVDPLSTDVFHWTAPADGGALSLTYDLLVAPAADGFASAASCVATGSSVTTAADTTTPAPGGVRYYLARAWNACGGSLGTDSSGVERQAPPCD